MRLGMIRLSVLIATVLSQFCAVADESASEPPPTLSGEAQPPSSTSANLSRIELKDGQVLRGRIVERNAENVTIELAGGGRVVIPQTLIAETQLEKNAYLTRSGQVWFFDPNRTHYFLSPSAMMLRGGEAAFSQSQLFASTFSVGATDFLTLTGGTMLPLWFLKDGYNFIGGIKLGVPIGEWLHAAAGASTFILPANSEMTVLGVALGTVTAGTKNFNLSLSAGYPFQIAKSSEVGNILFAISGSARIARGLAVMSENWILTKVDQETWFAIGGGLRIFGEHWATDIGLFGAKHATIPIPWVSFSYTFDM